MMEMYRKITKGDFRCPQWFSVDARRLLYRILDPNPRTRVTINRIMESRWFRKGHEHNVVPQLPPLSPTYGGEDISDVEAAFSSSNEVGSPILPIKEEEEVPMKLYRFNAFDIISLSSGFDLSGLFEKDDSQRQHATFTTKVPPSMIVSKLEEIAQIDCRFKVRRKNGNVRLERSKTGRTGQLSIDAEIFEVTPFFHVVEVKKVAGDTLEYRKFWEQDFKPFLNDIVWAWQGCEQQQQ